LDNIGADRPLCFFLLRDVPTEFFVGSRVYSLPLGTLSVRLEDLPLLFLNCRVDSGPLPKDPVSGLSFHLLLSDSDGPFATFSLPPLGDPPASLRSLLFVLPPLRKVDVQVSFFAHFPTPIRQVLNFSLPQFFRMVSTHSPSTRVPLRARVVYFYLLTDYPLSIERLPFLVLMTSCAFPFSPQLPCG